jgi:hypothetical protein
MQHCTGLVDLQTTIAAHHEGVAKPETAQDRGRQDHIHLGDKMGALKFWIMSTFVAEVLSLAAWLGALALQLLRLHHG